MRLLWSGEPSVDYGMMALRSEGRHGHEPDLQESFSGQSNGLAGAAVEGYLWLHTGRQTGEVGLAVELHDEAPPLDDVWEDVVEVSLLVTGPVELVTLADGVVEWDLGIPTGAYRVRYCAAGIDDGTNPPREGVVDRYALQFWLAPPGPDRIIRTTSVGAAHAHEALSQM